MQLTRSRHPSSTCHVDPAHVVGVHLPIAAGRCIFLDKPLLRRELSPRERHERLYKHALLSVALRSAQNAAAAAFGAPIRIASRAVPAAASRPASAGAAAASAAAAGGSPRAKAPDQLPRQLPGRHEELVSSAAAEAAGAAAADAAARAAAGGSSSGVGAGDDAHVAAAVADDRAAQRPETDSQKRLEDGLIVTTRRGCANDLWQLGRFRIIVRSHETAVSVVNTGQSPATGQVMVCEAPVALKHSLVDGRDFWVARLVNWQYSQTWHPQGNRGAPSSQCRCCGTLRGRRCCCAQRWSTSPSRAWRRYGVLSSHPHSIILQCHVAKQCRQDGGPC